MGFDVRGVKIPYSGEALARALQAHPLLSHQTTQATDSPAASTTASAALHFTRASPTHLVVCSAHPTSNILRVYDWRIAVFAFRAMPWLLLIHPGLASTPTMHLRLRNLPEGVQSFLPIPTIWLRIYVKYWLGQQRLCCVSQSLCSVHLLHSGSVYDLL